MSRKKLILDMDTGIDDAMAITLAAASEEADLIGVTCCFGNTTNAQAVKNTSALLSLLGRSDVPVFRGADRPEKADKPFETSEACFRIHGKNGIGNVVLPDGKDPDERTASDFIIESALKYGDDLILVPTGALTNIAAAIRKNRAAIEKIGRIVFMGGALTVAGNVSPVAEANIASDPDAAKYLLESGIPLTMVGLDVTLKALLRHDDIDRWAKCGKAGKALSNIVGYYIDNELKRDGCSLHDPLAVAAALDPALITTHAFAMTVITEGEGSGRTLARSYPEECVNKNVSVALEVEDRFVPEFTEKMTSYFEKLGREGR